MTSSQGTPHTLDFRAYKLLSFDIYGTLIDWETGIYTGLIAGLSSSSASPSPLPAGLSASLAKADTSRAHLFSLYEDAERRIQQAHPAWLAERVHAASFVEVVHGLAREVGAEGDAGLDSEEQREALEESTGRAFAQSVANWPAFSDTVEAMRRLGRRYKLVPLSNIDRVSFGKSLAGPLHGVPFAAQYLAEEIGSYKPDMRNFDFLIRKVEEDFGVEKGEVLHVAQSLYHDHVPAEKIGLKHVWVDRRGLMGNAAAGLKEEGKEAARWDLRVGSLAELADLVDAAWKAGEGSHKRYVH